jgi:SagB-type dehydrogenase family enzyme
LVGHLMRDNPKISDRKAAELAVQRLIDRGFLQVCDNKLAIEKEWTLNNWSEALRYHTYSNNLPKRMYNTSRGDKDDVAAMEQYVSKEEIPSNYRTHSGTSIQLDKPEKDLSRKVSDVALHDSKRSELSLPLLGRLLYYAFGQIGERHMQVTGAHVRKTVPSGGARHPIEVYILIKETIDSIPPGIYHYNVKKHALTLIQSLDGHAIEAVISEKLLKDDNRPGFDYKIAFVYACIFERSMFRYRESRSYRVMQFDLGHLYQNLCFLAKVYGLNMYGGYSFSEEEIENLIGIDSYLESCMGYTVL